MSGGVDSSVAAVLLIQQGYEVEGLTMLLGDEGEGAVRDAQTVCKALEIPHHVLELQEPFQREVIAPFEAEYLAGRTPNPCVRCNRVMKFGVLLEEALKLGAQFLATGHYAKIEQESGIYYLMRSAAGKKDQTYFLYTLNQHQLSHTLFPLCDLQKPQVRELAAQASLPVHPKKESQEICFIEGGCGDFIAARHPVAPGDFVLRDGTVIGRHKGIVHYTIGQRKGLGIAWRTPLYVLEIDKEQNKVILGDEEDLFASEMSLKEMVFPAEMPQEPIRARVRIRYGTQGDMATISPLAGGLGKVQFDVPQRAVTPGQAAVFYEGDRLIGGGVIVGAKQDDTEVH